MERLDLSPEKAVIALLAFRMFWFNDCRGVGLAFRGTSAEKTSLHTFLVIRKYDQGID